jgi:hypothetical protein
VAFLKNAFLEREVSLVSELIGNLPVQYALIFLDGQEQVGFLISCELKNDGELWSASAWISTPLKSSELSSSLRAARSWGVTGF